MAKTKTKKRGYKCGKCGGGDHNARTCKTDAADAPKAKKAAPKKVNPAVIEVKGEFVDVEPAADAKPEPVAQVLLSKTHTMTDIPKGPTPTQTISPLECPSCGQVCILALVERQDGQVLLRCERCMNKVQPKTILKWGATLKDKPAGQPPR